MGTMEIESALVSCTELVAEAAVVGRPDDTCLLYTSDAADERSSVDLGGRRIIKKKHTSTHGATVAPRTLEHLTLTLTHHEPTDLQKE